jgi:hypothetical protein
MPVPRRPLEGALIVRPFAGLSLDNPVYAMLISAFFCADALPIERFIHY